MNAILEASPKRAGPYRDSLGKRAANYVPLSPLSFLPKAAAVHPDRIALVHGAWRSTWAETYDRCRRLASALAQHGVGRGDTVAILAPNVPAMYEAHFGVPMTGAVLNTLNTRLDAEAIAFQLTHGEAKVFITDREFSAVAQRALSMLEHRLLGDRHRRSPAPERYACSAPWTTKRSSARAPPISTGPLPTTNSTPLP
jgi:fatty-acyl-CoA synthase